MAYQRKTTEPKCRHSYRLWRSERSGEYFYGRFHSSEVFFIKYFYETGKVFDWDRHLRETFVACMKPMTDKFMKVV
jgi:hypothetical protein